jgi:carboxypeptidase Taq
MNDKLNELKRLTTEIYDLRMSVALLEWDQQVNMPPAGGGARAAQMSLLSRQAHELGVSEKLGQLLEDLKPLYGELPPDSDDYALLRNVYRSYEQQQKIPVEYVSEFTQTTGEAFGVWARAKEKNDFASFRPWLEKIFDMRRQYAGFFAPYDHIYDPLLDDFEPGMKTAEVLGVFKVLRDEQVELLRELGNRPQVDDSFLSGHCDTDGQWALCREAVALIGYDLNRGRIDHAEHPFTTNFCRDDVRITTHIYEDNMMSAIFSSLHEGGHAIYEQGVAKELDRTPLGTGASLAIHESQSRLWENLVGRSREFLGCFYPRIQERFPRRFGGVALNDFYRAVNRVEPSLIRVEADEATYNLHVMLRMELEIALLERRITVADLPEIWREKMSEYLGVEPRNDSQGVLQDVHWACGMIGYFPTYALGNLISAQIWEQAAADLPDLAAQIGKGELASLREWLTGKLYRHGAKYYPSELVRMITGGGIDPRPYLNYLNRKYRAVYS